ncbi:glyoxylase-like metal-dependent hydrolase (beta-lactamase superfamily II) [Arthrobacter stackebrandtii]|uniref:Glyoxylase-like metal-dependent hydrolase (Beta-lactamase superfamily II) n=1 Tax=Arthrobacter stackebrandtii TaxID=272161 RepID=A0ABS4Z1T0_9MICC|nr:MBL fold metallo-hydrolase [Arthrobacter stackebrandtii]MBP2414680.1 glyoxylase-like metal-dependent hydrolase (beta-lactamase superfamily II) [Arthrobacter stackebrandtii]PYH01773.1 Zn-dependent hydrolase [Arthrobacter stackebrandtii]
MSEESSLIHDLPNHTVRRAVVSAMQNNVYLVTAKGTGAQILIDAADDLPAINTLLADAATDAQVPARLSLIATTHQHWDHVRALAALVAESGAPTAAGAADAEGIAAECGVATSQPLNHGDTVSVDGLELAAIHLRGHTPGSIAYVLAGGDDSAPIIFSGDSLFPGGVGNTEQDPARFTQLLNDVEARLFNEYPDAIVLPGHGNPTTLAAERGSLTEWRERGW